jgi:hypothetical protein
MECGKHLMLCEIKYLRRTSAGQNKGAKGPYELLLGKRAKLLGGRTLLDRGRLDGQNHRLWLHDLRPPEALGSRKTPEQIGHDFVDMDNHFRLPPEYIIRYDKGNVNRKMHDEVK